MLDFNIVDFFSMPFYKTKINISKNEIDFIKNHIEYYRCEEDKCFFSKSNMVFNFDALANTKKQIEQHIENFFFNILEVDEPNIKLYLKTSWCVLHQQGDFSRPHRHSNCILSGVLYLDVEDSEGDIIFLREFNETQFILDGWNFKLKSENKYNARKIVYTPKNNDLILFNPNTLHSVSPNTTTKDRLVVAFDVFFRGTIGKGSLHEINIF